MLWALKVNFKICNKWPGREGRFFYLLNLKDGVFKFDLPFSDFVEPRSVKDFDMFKIESDNSKFMELYHEYLEQTP